MIVPTSLLAAITETSTVRSVSAVGDGLGRDQAVGVGGDDRQLPALARQPLQRVEHGPVLGRRRDEVVAPWPGGPATTPLIARLFASVAPEVKTTSRGSAPISAATCARARSTASAASQPNRCEPLAALP